MKMAPDAAFDDLVTRRKAACGHELTDVPDPSSLFSGRPDPQFVWVTLRQPSMIEKIAMWFWHSEGLVRLGAVVRLGDALNGPVGHIHGGFMAALCDDLLSWCAAAQRDVQGLGLQPLVTANLNVNYLKLVPCDNVYYVELSTQRVEKERKVYVAAIVYDADGEAKVDATALFILMRSSPWPASQQRPPLSRSEQPKAKL